MKRWNKEMFSCLVLERLAPLDMMDEPGVWIDKSWTDGSDTHSSHNTAASRLKQEGHLVVVSLTTPQMYIFLFPELVVIKYKNLCFKCQTF